MVLTLAELDPSLVIRTAEELDDFLQTQGEAIHSQMCGWARRHCVCQPRAEHALADMIAEAFLRIKRGTDPVPNFVGWLLRSAQGVALRSRPRETSIEALSFDPTPEGRTQEQEELRKAQLAALATALHELPEEDRIVLNLHFFLGLAVSELAIALARCIGSASRRLELAIDHLREAAILILLREGYDFDEIS
jgi:RNA polymerase sigma factor (sigma-70 family)